jgi:hypothetical protein
MSAMNSCDVDTAAASLRDRIVAAADCWPGAVGLADPLLWTFARRWYLRGGAFGDR